MRIERVAAEEIIDLRWSVLREGLPRETAIYPEDAQPDAFHFAAYDATGRVAGCVTFFLEPLDGVPGHRIRGMASAPDVRGQGYGAAVLRAGMAEAVARGAKLIWCYGRTAVQDFYEHFGFTPSGDVLHPAPTHTPHYVFTYKVPA